MSTAVPALDSKYNRLFLVALASGLLFVGITFRIFYLTFLTGHRGSGASEQIRRGPILDRRGLRLAVTEEASTIAVAPHEIVDPEFTARHLAPFLELSADEILLRIREREKRRYFILKRSVENHPADQITELHLPGIYREWEFKRTYPADTLAANLIGFVGRDTKHALGGLERVYHQLLIQPERANSTRGPELHLTLDALLQNHMEQELERAFLDSGSKRAVGILMDVRTGEILALANFPGYNPNEYYRSRPFQRANWAIRFNYEPGSTAKIFMMAILLADRKIALNEKFHCDGSIALGDVVVHCKYRGKVHKHGDLTPAQILEHSCNVGMIKAMQRADKKRWYEYMRALGFGEKTGVLPANSGETSGYFPPLSSWVPSSRFYIPIGQSFSVTPIQLLRGATSLANGGKLVRPYIASTISTSEGKILNRNHPSFQRNPFSPAVNNTILKMMRGVVRQGSGRGAQVAGVSVAGKTGTAQKATSLGYVDKYVASFVGFFPLPDTRYSMLILFDEPQGHAGGGSLAAPVFGRILRRVLPILERDVRTVNLDNFKIRRVPLPLTEPGRLPDFRGLSLREAVHLATSRYGLTPAVRGSGTVVDQRPRPGTPIDSTNRLELILDDR